MSAGVLPLPRSWHRQAQRAAQAARADVLAADRAPAPTLSAGASSIDLPLGWLWVGWQRQDPGGTSAKILSVSAFETR